MKSQFISYLLNSSLLNSSQIFSTHLTLSICICLVFLENLRRVTRKCRGSRRQKKEHSTKSTLRVRRGCVGLQHQPTSPASGAAVGFSARVASTLRF